MSEWISVKERLPENNQKVLACSVTGTMLVATYDQQWERWRVFSNVGIAYWAELPSPPVAVAENATASKEG